MYDTFDMTKTVPVDRPKGGIKLYTEQSPDAPGTVSFPNADDGKSKLYESQPGTYYSTAGRSQKSGLDVGKGMPAGSESNKGTYDPTIPVKRGGPEGGPNVTRKRRGFTSP